MVDNELQALYDLDEVSFIEFDTLDEVRERLIENYQNEYEQLTGQSITLSPSDPIRLMLNACALVLYQHAMYTNRAGKQDLIKYAYGEFLDHLGIARGVVRKKATKATTTIRFTLSATRPYVVEIPEDTRLTDGQMYFATMEYAEILPGEMSIEVMAECEAEGIIGNDIPIGAINTLCDPIPFIDISENITITSGGSDIEDDENLRLRVLLAPASYSVAGPDDAYKYWTKTYSQEIGDVQVTSPRPVDVEIYLLMQDGSLPTQSTIDGVTAFLQDGNMRPLTDRVTVYAPTPIEFSIDLTYYINYSNRSNALMIQQRVLKAIDDYIKWQTYYIGRDINPSELTKRIVEAGAKRVEVREPIYQQVANIQVARLGEQAIVYGGIERD